MTADLTGGGLFGDAITTAPTTLSDKFGVPPLSILDRRGGDWQARRREWLALGIASGDGRGDALAFAKGKGTDPVSQQLMAISNGTSIFDPVLTEIMVRWFSAPGDVVVDPFAGGSVRGLVTGALGRRYIGGDVRQEQVEANCDQRDTFVAPFADYLAPAWLIKDAVTEPWATRADMVLTCPPYADLEVYSDDPRDISTWSHRDFLDGHDAAIGHAVEALRDDRYAVWVIGDVRAKDGTYLCLIAETIRSFRDRGCGLLNEFVMVEPVGGAAVRAERPFVANRKATKTHQNVLVFVKGNVRAAADRIRGERP